MVGSSLGGGDSKVLFALLASLLNDGETFEVDTTFDTSSSLSHHRYVVQQDLDSCLASTKNVFL